MWLEALPVKERKMLSNWKVTGIRYTHISFSPVANELTSHKYFVLNISWSFSLSNSTAIAWVETLLISYLVSYYNLLSGSLHLFKISVTPTLVLTTPYQFLSVCIIGDTLIYSQCSPSSLMPNIFAKTVQNLSSVFTFENHCLRVNKDAYKARSHPKCFSRFLQLSHQERRLSPFPLNLGESVTSSWPPERAEEMLRGFWIQVIQDNAVFALLAGTLVV